MRVGEPSGGMDIVENKMKLANTGNRTRIVQIVVKYSAITSLDISDNGQYYLRSTDIGTELHQQWLFQHRTAKQVCSPYHAGLYGDIQIKINISYFLLQ